MRAAKICILVSLVILVFLYPPILAQDKHDAIVKPIPKIRSITLYTWALSTGGTKVDFDTKQLMSFLRGTRLSDEEEEALRKKAGNTYSIYRILAILKKQDIIDIEKQVSSSHLRDFQPRNSDVKKRNAYLDECPPTLVIIWTDKTKVYSFPLHNTVRKNIPKCRQLAYQDMDKLYDTLSRLNDKYGKKPNVSAVLVKSKEYKAFEKERDRMVR